MKTYLLLICLSFSAWVTAQTDIQRVKDWVIQDIRRSAPEPSNAVAYGEQLSSDGTWPDIDYDDVSRTGFQHAVHLDRLFAIANALSGEDSPYYDDAKLKAALQRGIDHWLREDYQCENWWHNEVNTPKELVQIALLAGPWLEEGTVDRLLPIIDRGDLSAKGARPGGDRIKFAGTEALRELLKGNEAGFARAMRLINDELDFATGERGLQRDLSFHHRADRVNNTVSYGQNHAFHFAKWAVAVAGTRYAFQPDKQELLIDYFLDGICKQYALGVYPDPGVMNRDVTRVHQPGPASTKIAERLLQVSDYRSEDLQRIIDLREGRGKPSSFAKFFWQTEHFVFQRPEFYVSVRMHSSRNGNMEAPYNGEGFKNHYRGDGASYLSVKGDEYLNIAPVNDWRKIPGTTVEQRSTMPGEGEIRRFGLTDFVGAVTDGRYGAVGYDFISPHDRTRARKAWFFFDDRYVCLGAGVESAGGAPIVTTIEQNRLSGLVIVGEAGRTRALKDSTASLRGDGWVLHNGVAYVGHEGPKLEVRREARSGYWKSVNRSWDMPKGLVRDSIFCLFLDHGAYPHAGRGGFSFASTAKQDVGYAYSVYPHATLDLMEQPPYFSILSNTRDLQAVHHHELGLTYIIAYRAGSITLPDGQTISLDSPAALMIDDSQDGTRSITASDPARNLARLHLTLSAHGPLTIDLPQGEWAGSSTTVTVKR